MTEHRAGVEQPYAYRRVRAGRARLDPLPGLDGRHRRGVGVRAVAARALREEHQAAARADGRPARRALLRRPRARPGRAGHDVDAGAAADDEHDGPARGAVDRRRSTPTRCAATCCRSSRDRRTDWPSHPHATRDSLHEHDMWVAEGLTHRYPTKVLAELLSDLPAVLRPLHADGPRRQLHAGGRQAQVRRSSPSTATTRCSTYLRAHPGVRDVVVSGGDVANMPWPRLEAFLDGAARDREHPRHPPRHQGADGHAAALAAGRGRRRAWSGSPRPRARRGVVARDPHPRQPRQLGDAAGGEGGPRRCSTPASATCATRACCCAASTTTRTRLLDLCFALRRRRADPAVLLLHVRHDPELASTGGSPSRDAQQLQHDIMGYLPGFATPRIVCDVPFVGKRWVHQLADVRP